MDQKVLYSSKIRIQKACSLLFVTPIILARFTRYEFETLQKSRCFPYISSPTFSPMLLLKLETVINEKT